MRFMKRCLIVCVAFLMGACDQGTEAPAPSFGKVDAPDMSLSYLDGSSANLSDLRGQVVLLNFWATWCPPCLQELPHFEALHQAYRDRGLAVVGLSMDQAGKDYVENFSKEAGITYLVAMSPFEDMEKIWGAIESIPTVHGFGSEEPSMANGSVQMMPTTFVIDKAGRIYRKHVGPRDRETLEPELLMLMGIESLASG